ncbi:MAG: hypothetical protein IPG54_08735 [Sphingomonadales bacterium]|nr:hypothetical protein [Sphingomonadales bacterium]
MISSAQRSPISSIAPAIEQRMPEKDFTFTGRLAFRLWRSNLLLVQSPYILSKPPRFDPGRIFDVFIALTQLCKRSDILICYTPD